MQFMKGYLTYALAAGGVIWAIAGFSAGVVDSDTAMMVVWASLAVFGIRRAIN